MHDKNNSENDNNDNNDKNDKNPIPKLALYLPRFFFLEFVRNAQTPKLRKLLSKKSKILAAAVAVAVAR